MRVLALTISLIVMTSAKAIADEARFTGSTTSEMFYFSVDETGGSPNGRGVGRRDMDVTLNSVGPTSFHHSLTYTLAEPLTWTWTTTRPIPDTFTMVPITTSVTLNPFSISQNDIGPVRLFSNPFYLSEDVTTSRPLFDPVPVSGSYRITGPTQDFMGTFADTFLPVEVMPQFDYDVSTFPDMIQAQRGGGGLIFRPDPLLRLFSGTVDGAPWSVHLSELRIDTYVHDEFRTLNQIARTWTGANSNWSVEANWIPSVPNGPAQRAVFGNSDTRTVTLDIPVTVGRLEIDNILGYTIGGENALRLEGVNADTSIRVESGNHTISAPVVLADNTDLSVALSSNLSILGPLSSGRLRQAG